jgi:hypothetical protein
MKFTRARFYISLAVGPLLVISTAAQERSIKKSELPAAVQKAAEEQSKEATVRGYSTEVENGKREYEMEMMANGRRQDVTIAPDGTVLEIEQQVEMSKLPAAVRDSLRAKAGSGQITKIESLTKHGKLVAYEAQVRRGGEHSEIQVGPDGKLLSHPE